MRKITAFLFTFLLVAGAPINALADTPPANSVKAKLYSGDGTTAIGHVGDAAKVQVANPTDTTGLATSAKQDTGNTSLGSIDTKLSSQATAAAQATGNASLGSIDTKMDAQATAVKQDTGNTSLGSIDTKLSSQATAAAQATGNASLSSMDTKLSSQATAANQSTGNASLSSIDGKLGSLGQKAMTGSAPVVLASDQPALPPSFGSSGSVSNNAAITTATTFTAPANAVGFILEAESTNTANLRWAVGSTATSSVGHLMEPGRDTGFVPLAADISVIAISGTQAASVQWVIK